MSIEIIPTGAALGAEISGVDMAQPIDDAVFATIERAYNDHGVIFFRDHHITPPQQVAFTRCLSRSNSTSSESDGAFPVVPKSS